MTETNASGPEPVVLFLNFNYGEAMYRRQLDGIRRYAKARGWDVEARSCAEAGPEDIPALLADLDPIGCIDACARWRPGIPRHLFGRTPVCIIGAPVGAPRRGTPTVDCDNAAVASTAFRELSSGIPSTFAVVPYREPSRRWSRARVTAFLSLCRKKRLSCSAFPECDGETGSERAARLQNWVAALPDHCAVFAVNDPTAREVLDALRAAGRPVPRSATLVGADCLEEPGDETPTISSVRIDFELSGYLAAKMLAERIAFVHNSQICNCSHLFGPLLVERRDSTGGRGRREPYVMRAVDIIRREACNGLTAAKLASLLPGSRNLFERRFREATGHSVLEEILQVRFARVFELLLRTEVPIGTISDFCGFPSNNDFHRLFLARFGESPGQWRKARAQ